MSLARKATVLLVSAVVLASCIGTRVTTTVPFVVDVVRDENNIAIPGAVVTTTNPNLIVSGDSTGAFAVKGLRGTAAVTFTASAPGYADRTMVVYPPANLTGVLTITTNLRQIGNRVTITLPAGSDAPIKVSAQQADGAAVLTIPPGSLVDPNGNVAVGNANVTMTYWHPLQSMSSAPAPLLTTNPTGAVTPATLRSWGMTAIEVEQGGAKLQVATGQSLPLAFAVPQTMQSLIGAHFPQPDLYYLNRTTALWDLVGTMAAGAVTYANGTLTVNLPHLSEWNLDGLDATPGGPGNQGCVRGTIYNACACGAAAGTTGGTGGGTTGGGSGVCNLPLVNGSALVWFMAWEELSSYQVTTNASGVWCMNHATRDIMPGQGAGDSDTIAFYVSGASGPQNSSVCVQQPIPAACVACAGLDAENGCCRFQIDYQAGNAASFTTPEAPGVGGTTCNQYFSQGWNASAITDAECRYVCPQIQPTAAGFSHFLPCHICPGTPPPYGGACYGDMNQGSTNLGYDNNCVDLDKVFGAVTVSDGTCADPVGGVPPPPPCTPLQPGTPCVSTAECCSPTLVCADDVCVPPKDP